MAQQRDPLPAARGRPHLLTTSGRPVTLSVLFILLSTSSLAASSAREHKQQLPAWGHSTASQQRQSLWKRAVGPIDDSFEPLYERPVVYEPTRGDFDSDDEQFLRQLKEAAEYLDERLAARQRDQQQRALLAKLGHLIEPPADARGRPGPAYSLEAAPDEQQAEAQGADSVVVVGPSEPAELASGPGAFSGPLEPHYRMVADENDEPSEAQPDQQAQPTYDRHKQLLKTLLLDKAGASEQQAIPALKRDSSPLNESEDAPRSSPPPGRPHGKLTTLLEEEEEDEPRGEGGAESPAGGAAATSAPSNGSTYRTSGPWGADEKEPAFGRVVYAANATATNAPRSAQGATSGVFGRMYAQLAHYLPFINQISILRDPAAAAPANAKQEPKVYERDDAHPEHQGGEQKIGVRVKVSGAQAAGQGEAHSGEANGQPHAKPSVSVSLARGQQQQQQHHENQGQEREDTSEGNSDNQKREHDKQQEQGQGATGERGLAQKTSTKGGTAKRLSEPSVEPSTGDLEVDMSQLVPVVVAPVESRSPYSHLMRQTSLGLPEAARDGADSLLGRYIYAPTQHYYLNSQVLPSTRTTLADDKHHHQLLAANAARNLHPGQEIYSSYTDEPAKAAYAFQKDPSLMMSGIGGGGGGGGSTNNLANKTNDLYFLIMVGAFCVMAMAVVLAAGAFAYRVQQGRRSSQEQDYPTYGVVGPNNMSAKCGGASSFTMGGYLMGGPPPVAANKSGSAKHLPDLYSTVSGSKCSAGAASGTGGSDSGLNSLGRSSQQSNKKAAASSSASSLNNNEQPGSRSGAASQDAARMYHYQHQKQQMINSAAGVGGRHTSASDLDSEDENDDGSYTVYECPGLASAHEMEIKNPLFNDDQTP